MDKGGDDQIHGIHNPKYVLPPARSAGGKMREYKWQIVKQNQPKHHVGKSKRHGRTAS